MTDQTIATTTTTESPTTTPTTTMPPAPLPKPGWRTTEFWMKLAAILLTVLFASGVIPTSGTAALVAAIAATMLGALGYTVSRSLVKMAGVFLLFGLLASTQMACGARPAASAGGMALLDCEAEHFDAQLMSDAVALGRALASKWMSGHGDADLAMVKADLLPIRTDLVRCGIAGAIAAVTSLTTAGPAQPISQLSEVPGSVDVRMLFVHGRGEAGWPPLKLPTGAVL